MKKQVGMGCVAVLAALVLVSCGGGGSGSAGGGGSGGTPPPTGGGGTPAPAPAPTPTPTPAPAFSFSSSFAFDTALGIESTVFFWQDGATGQQRIEAVTPRYLSSASPARLTFERQASGETVRIRFDGVDRTFTSSSGPGGGFRRYFGPTAEEELRIGPFSPFFTRGQDETAELATVLYNSEPTGFTSGTRVGTARRVLYGIVGNPSVETGRVSVSKRFVTEGGFTSLGDVFILTPQSLVTISGDYNTGIFGGFLVGRNVPGSPNPEQLVNLSFKGAHDPATNRLSGSLRDPSDRVVGTFEGALYGPGRRRIGLVYEFTIPETGNLRHIGFLFGLEG